MTRRKALCALLPLLLSLPMCSGGDDDSGTPTGSPLSPSGSQAVLRVYLTDKPIASLTGVWVTVASVKVHQSAAAGEGEGGWVEIPLAAPMPVNLLALQSGILKELGQAPLPPGHYQQVRLALAPNAAGQGTPNNYVEIAAAPAAEGSVPAQYPIDVPSGTIKIVHQFSTAAGQVSDLVLDFIASDSVKQRGNDTYFLQPVIKASSVSPPAAP